MEELFMHTNRIYTQFLVWPAVLLLGLLLACSEEPGTQDQSPDAYMSLKPAKIVYYAMPG